MELSDPAAKGPKPTQSTTTASNIKINLKPETNTGADTATTNNVAKTTKSEAPSTNTATASAATSAATSVAVKASPGSAQSSSASADDKTPKKKPPAAAVAAQTAGNNKAPAKADATKAASKGKPNPPADMIQMATGELPIHISNKNPVTYTSANWETYRSNRKPQNNLWDMVIINHNKQYAKPEILDALFLVTGNCEFYPVAYRRSKIGDLFLLRNCPTALNKLIQAKLKLLMADGQEIGITVKLEVAPFAAGQIVVRNKLVQLMQQRRQSLITVEKLPKVLDLSALHNDPSLAELVLHLGSTSSIAQINMIIRTNHQELMGGVRGLKLSGNRMARLSTFRQWQRTYVHLLDLSDNNIEDVQELAHLERIVFVELIVTGNPFVGTTPNFMIEIKKMFSALRTINGTDITNMVVPKTPRLPPPPPVSSSSSTSSKSSHAADSPKSDNPKTSSMVLNPAAIAPPPPPMTQVINPAAVVASSAHRKSSSSSTSSSSHPSSSDRARNSSRSESSTGRSNSASTSHKSDPKKSLPQPVPPPAVSRPHSTQSTAAADTFVQPSRAVSPPRPVPPPSVTVAATSLAAPTLQLKVKSFATIGAAPLPPDVAALGGGPCSDAGEAVVAAHCARGATFFRKYKTSTMWHRVVVTHSGEHSKADILENLWRQLGSTDIFPCYYSEHPTCDIFFVRNAYDALEHLVNAKLLLRMLPSSQSAAITAPGASTSSCTLTLHMNVGSYKTGQIDAAEQISTVIGRCFSMGDKTLNLSRFAEHRELSEIELRLSNAHTLADILMQAARRYLGNVQRLRLCGNQLTGTMGMRPLTWMKELRSVDLSDNCIADVSALAAMPSLQTIEEFALHDNPLVQMEPLAYITAVKRFLPNLVRLDGHQLGAAGCSVTHQNYLCSLDGYDLVEQFCEQYFAMFDGLRLMKQLYLDRALMTMSCSLQGATCDEATLRNYTSRSRNLWKSPLSAVSHILQGGEAIEARCRSFGLTEHDMSSFTIDLMHYTSQVAVFTVNGMYRETNVDGGPEEEQTIFGFVRTFVLRRARDGLGLFGQSSHHVIVNEQVLIYRPSMLQLSCAFKRRPAAAIDDLLDGGEPTANEKDGLVIVFQEITNLMPVWCSKFLEQASWQLRHALELFVHLCEENKVPDHAFVEIATKLSLD